MLCDPINPLAGLVPLTCEQTRDRKLKCSAPAGECHMDEMSGDSVCYSIPGTWDKFYMIPDRLVNSPALVMASDSNPPTIGGLEAIELQLFPHAD